ncbi:MAG: ABC transporter ATP-binding protein, partial [Thermoleophilaceae bacterium]
GLDPGGMRDMRLLIRRLAEDGITVLLSSHQLAEVEEVCNRVAIIRRGRIAFEGTLADMRGRTATLYRLRTTDPDRALEICAAQAGIADARLDGGREIVFTAEQDAVAALSVALVDTGVAITALVPQAPTLEELFFRFTE